MIQSDNIIAIRSIVGALALVPAVAAAQDLSPAAPAPQPMAATPAAPAVPVPAAVPGAVDPAKSTDSTTSPTVTAPDVAAPPALVATADATAPATTIKVPEALKSVNIGVWLRSALRLQNPGDPKKVNDQSLSYYAELHIGGAIYDKVNYTLNFNVQNQTNDYPGSVRVLDAIAQLDAMDEFHLWAGQMLVPCDRSNFSGPFFMSPWNYPGVYSVGSRSAFIGPAEGPAGRNTGTTVWGDFEKGLFKYYAGMFNLTDAGQSPLFSGRVNFAPIGKEPGFYHSSTYYGDKDVVALGVGAQYQKRGSLGVAPTDATGSPTGPAPIDDFSELNADLLGEFRVGNSVITGEAAYYHFGGDYNPADDAFYVLASYLSPKIGVGSLQPLLRYQWAKEKTTDTKMSVIDAHVAYVVKQYSLRTLVGFQHTNMDHGIEGNAIQIGVQLMTL